MTTAATPLVAVRRRAGLPPSMLMAGIRILSDFLALSLSALLASELWSVVNPLVSPHPGIMWLPVPLSFAGLAFHRLYPGVGFTAVDHMRRICHSISFIYLLLTASMFVVKDWWATSRGGFFLSWALSLILVPMARWLSTAHFRTRDWWGIPVVILGAGEAGRAVVRNVAADHALGYRPVACLDDDPAKLGECAGVPVTGGLAAAQYFADVFGVRCAIVAMPGLTREELIRHLERLSRIFPKVVIVPDLFGVASLWTEPRDLGGILGLEIRCNLLNPASQLAKRAIDVGVSLFGLIATAPLVAIAALWVKRASPGPAFYFQEREGKGGSRIRIVKLRTMHPDADRRLQEHLAANASAAEEWGRYCKLRRDPRIIGGVGSFLRQTSLDELPQLWNIVRGEMSLVGPRPFPEYHNGRFQRDFRSLRTRVTPGLTGLWQVTARSNGDLDAQRSLDTYYIRNWSPWLDFYIVVCTIRTVLARDGAY